MGTPIAFSDVFGQLRQHNDATPTGAVFLALGGADFAEPRDIHSNTQEGSEPPRLLLRTCFRKGAKSGWVFRKVRGEDSGRIEEDRKAVPLSRSAYGRDMGQAGRLRDDVAHPLGLPRCLPVPYSACHA
jgi:hypothetical protein